MMITDGKNLTEREENFKALPAPERRGTGHGSTARSKFESTAEIVAAARQEVGMSQQQIASQHRRTQESIE